MTFSFEFDGTPPTLADMAVKREEAVIERAVFRKKNIRFMIGMATVTSVWVAFLIIVIIPMMTDTPQLGIITYYFPYLTFLIFIVGNHLHIKNIEKPSKLLDKTIAELSEVTADEISSITGNKEHPPEIVSYLERIAATGRSAVGAERDVIQKWYDKENLERLIQLKKLKRLERLERLEKSKK